ncbi:ketosteroid isomerase-like protein [Povalibacter uvarum]|uniref:Ketosteroid isomerase-like protein n=1 Tax=Povalibacter uvarum TaxID=732238 RepID=A0A841HN30_9GAMM|nr:hypothetical protein [Povalibacter uvarum]MBB6093355.1 ketosteroid isomerase-like protein [Povalibacter uvarum]
MLRRFSVLLTCVFLISACGSSDSPETQVRRAIDAMEKAAEARDVSDLMEFVADDFRDQYGQDRDQLRQYLMGYFIANQSIHLLTRIDELELPGPDEALVRMTIGMVGREADAANAWNLAADVQDFEITLRREDDDWKVMYAKRGSR